MIIITSRSPLPQEHVHHQSALFLNERFQPINHYVMFFHQSISVGAKSSYYN